MKNVLVFVFFFIATQLFSQSNFKLNLLGSFDHSFANYDALGGTKNESLDYKLVLGYTVGVALEYTLNDRFSISSGLRYAQRNIRPRMQFGSVYGTSFNIDGESKYMIAPYLAEHNFKTLHLPVLFNYYFKKGERFSWFAKGGMVLGFQIGEEEVIKDAFFRTDGSLTSGQITELKAEEKTFRHFNSTLELGLGFRYKLNATWSVLTQWSAQVLEYRSANEKFKKNGHMLWEDSLLPIGQLSIGVGIQKAF